MAKEKVSKEPQPASDAVLQQFTGRYIGPSYEDGILLFGEITPIRPADFTEDEIKEFITKHPERAVWFLS